MTRKQLLLPNIQLTLLFQTVPSATTLSFAMSLAPNTQWHLLRRKDGVYLQHYLKRGSQPFHQLVSFPDPTIALHEHLKIVTQTNAFTVYPFNNRVEYGSDGIVYTPLSGTQNFLSPIDHRFKCGSLEFLLSFQSQ